MGEKSEKLIAQLTKDVAKWKSRALEAANKACRECEQVPVNCDKCRIHKIKEQATE